MWSSWARPVLPRASLASPARWHMVHSIHVSRHTVYWVQAQVGFGRVYFPGPNRVGARAHFMRWAQPILRLSRRACARANDGLASVNAGQPLMKNLSHFVKSVLYTHLLICVNIWIWKLVQLFFHYSNLVCNMTSFNILAFRSVSCAVDVLQFRIMCRIYLTGIIFIKISFDMSL